MRQLAWADKDSSIRATFAALSAFTVAWRLLFRLNSDHRKTAFEHCNYAGNQTDQVALRVILRRGGVQRAPDDGCRHSHFLAVRPRVPRCSPCCDRKHWDRRDPAVGEDRSVVGPADRSEWSVA